MVAAAFLLFRAFFKMLRSEEEEKKEEKRKPKTLRYNLITLLSLLITTVLGLTFFKVVEEVIKIILNLGV